LPSTTNHIHLLLTLVRVDASPLTRLQHEQVHAEGAYAELAAQRHEALVRAGVERREGQVGLAHIGSVQLA
jgi:hypothetical protein